MSQLALDLIQEAKRTHAKTLDLGNCDLTELPDELFELVDLEVLCLCTEGGYYDLDSEEDIRFKSRNKGEKNSIKRFSPKISHLINLKVLLAHGKYDNNWELSDLSPLKDLTQLQLLDVSETQVIDLSPLKELNKLLHLYVSRTQVIDLSPLKDLTQLEHLDVAETKVIDFNPLENLTRLLFLNVSCTQVVDLNPLKKLTQLQVLFVCEARRVIDLSPLKELTQLQYLDLSDTQVVDLSTLKELTQLQQLSVSYSKTFDLSPLKDLIQLQQLDFSHTKVIDLSPLKDLIQLQQLDLSRTKVIDLSPLKELTQLQELNLYETLISDLTPLKKIIENNPTFRLEVDGCPLSNPPYEIVKQGNQAILNYWKQIEEQGTQTINEGKLIIVGEGDTGKTTLFNKLIDPTFEVLNNPSSETQGINIHEGLLMKDGFRANLWDFGGQELQYMTHQFFLTPQSVYVLMMASRSEAPNLAYWFKIISLLGKDKSNNKVSIILVLNKKKGSTGTPQYQDLLNLYEDEFDCQFIEVDLSVNDKRWESLKEAIEERLLNLPNVKNALPKQWKPIREALRKEADTKPYISAERLGALCEPFRVSLQNEQFLMTEYLHQLGSVLHFQDVEDSLLDLIVLSPEWAVEGVYTVLKSEHIRETLKGKFTATDIAKVLCESQYKNGDTHKHYSQIDAQKLLLLMSKNNFDICYQSESGLYIAAQLLDDDRPPQYIWETKHKSVLQFRYQYPIMPKGLMSRLIVRLSEHLEKREGVEIVWKKGAILQMKLDGSTCRVMMREEDGETKTGLRQIVIEVMEDKVPFRNRKYALQRVRQEIESLHKKWFKNIKAEQIVPCNCETCKTLDEPFTFQLSELLELKKGRAYCNKLEDFVPLHQLLEGVYESSEIQSFENNKGDKRADRGRMYNDF